MLLFRIISRLPLTSRAIARPAFTALSYRIPSRPFLTSIPAFETTRIKSTRVKTTTTKPKPKSTPKSAPKSKSKSRSKPAAKRVSAKKSASETKKKVAVKKKVTLKKKKKPIVKKKRPTRFAQSLRPPRPPANVFGLYYKQYLKQVGRPDSKLVANDRVREASKIWATFSTEQKQPYYEEYRALREDYEKKREEYYKNVDPKLLRDMNKARAAKGKPRYHGPRRNPEDRKPLNRFINYVLYFRTTQEAQEIIAESARNRKSSLPGITLRATEKWKQFSDEEKASYNTPRSA